MRRQQQADRAPRLAKQSPGWPMPARHVEREFMRDMRPYEVSTPRWRSACQGRSDRRWFRHAGGMPPVNLDEPAGRYLTFDEREPIARLKTAGLGVQAIAGQLERDPSTIFRELRRNAATRGGKVGYRASMARWKAQTVAKRPRSPSSPGIPSCGSTCSSAWQGSSSARTRRSRWGHPRRGSNAARGPMLGDSLGPRADLPAPGRGRLRRWGRAH